METSQSGESVRSVTALSPSPLLPGAPRVTRRSRRHGRCRASVGSRQLVVTCPLADQSLKEQIGLQSRSRFGGSGGLGAESSE